MGHHRLSDLAEGECAWVESLCISGTMRRRMQDIGLIEGTKVSCVMKSPAGDPAAYKIRGAVIALRREDARQVMVNKVQKGEKAWG